MGKQMKTFCVLLGLIAVIVALPLNELGQSDVELLDETWSTSNAKAEVAAMDKAVKHARVSGKVLDFDEKVLQDLNQNEKRVDTDVSKVAKMAREVPKEWGAGKTTAEELKASTKVAGTLMGMKDVLRTEIKDTAAGMEDGKKLKMAQDNLGEAKAPSLAQARKHAKLWLEGRKLADDELALEKKEASGAAAKQAQLQSLSKHVLRWEKKANTEAKSMSKQVDEAGAALNKWYDAHDKKAQPSHTYRLGEVNKGPLNDAQQRIEKAAEKSIMEVAATAKKAMKAAATTDKKKVEKKKEKKVEKKKVEKKNTFDAMKQHVNKVAKSIGKVGVPGPWKSLEKETQHAVQISAEQQWKSKASKASVGP